MFMRLILCGGFILMTLHVSVVATAMSGDLSAIALAAEEAEGEAGAASVSVAPAPTTQACELCTTPHQAAQQAHTSCMQHFIASGANIHRCEQSTLCTPLHYAAQHNFDPLVGPNVLTLLIAAGVNLNAKNFTGYTPCHIAALGNCAHTLATLLDAGANAELKTGYSDTPLDFAIYHLRVECIKVLIIRGFTATKYPHVVENYLWDPEVRLQTAEYGRLRAYLAPKKIRKKALKAVAETLNVATYLQNRELYGLRAPKIRR